MKESGQISPLVATAVGLGAIIGAGIFVLSGTAIALAGSNALLAFLIVGVVAFIIALEFGELGSIMPNTKGASYSYVYKAFGSELGFITGLLQYFSFATAISVISLGFGSYLASILGLGSGYEIFLAIGLILLLSIVNILGIKNAVKADFWLVALKLATLLAFIAFAFLLTLKSGRLNAGNFLSLPSQQGLDPLFGASIAIFFAYTGFQAIATFTSKIKGGSKAAAKAIIASVLVSIVIYILVVFSLILLVPASSYSIVADPLSFALIHANAPNWLLLIVDTGALLATASATLAMILGSSRMLYQMSEDRLLPSVLRAYDKKKDVAIDGIIISAVIGSIMLFAGNIYIIAAISNFGLLFSYLMASFAVIHFRREKIGRPSFKIPLYPYLSILAVITLILFIAVLPREALIIGVIMILSLIIIYYALREASNKRVVRVRLFK